MARKRMIDPNIWQSEDFSNLSTLAKLVFIGLFSNADDKGRGRAKAAYIKSILFPYDEGMRVIDVDKTLSEIASNMSVTFYLHDDSEYYSLDKWSKWQKIDKPTDSILPGIDDHSTIIRRTLDESSSINRIVFSPNRIEENRIEKEKKETRAHAKSPPATCDDLQSLEPKVQEAFGEYIKARVKLKRQMTPHAVSLAVKKLRSLAGDDPDLQVAHIDQAIEHGWLSFYPLNNNSAQCKNPKSEQILDLSVNPFKKRGE